MRLIKKEEHEILVYSSIQELPIKRFRKMQQQLLQEAGIGSDIQAIDERLQNIVLYSNEQKQQELVDEITNLRYSLFSTISQLDYKSMALACLIKKIDGVEYDDLSGDGLQMVINKLGEIELTIKESEDWLNEVKKKLMQN